MATYLVLIERCSGRDSRWGVRERRTWWSYTGRGGV